MSIEIRHYDHAKDFDRVGQFLIDTFQSGDFFLNWLQPRWEYMHYHPLIKELDLSKIGIAEEEGKIIGVVNFEHQESQVYLHVHPNDVVIFELLVEYAEKYCRGKSSKDGREHLVVFVNNHNPNLKVIVEERGYEIRDDYSETHSRIVLNESVQAVDLPQGFAIQSLADENDVHKINQVLWRGFNHEGPAPGEDIQGRREMQQAPNFCKELNIVAVSSEGHYVSYSGIWYVESYKVAYVEPVATDPDYRRMGLGKAAVLECVRRVKDLGAEVVWVGSGLEFYKAIGFTNMFDVHPWVKYFEGDA